MRETRFQRGVTPGTSCKTTWRRARLPGAAALAGQVGIDGECVGNVLTTLRFGGPVPLLACRGVATCRYGV